MPQPNPMASVLAIMPLGADAPYLQIHERELLRGRECQRLGLAFLLAKKGIDMRTQ